MADKHPVRTRIVSSLVVAAILSFITYLIPGGWTWVITKLGHVARVVNCSSVPICASFLHSYCDSDFSGW